MGSNQTSKFLHSKGNPKQNKDNPDWERIFANESTDKGLISKIYKQLLQLHTKEHSLISCTKINSKWIKGSNVWPDTKTLKGGKHRQNTL